MSTKGRDRIKSFFSADVILKRRQRSSSHIIIIFAIAAHLIQLSS